MKPYRTIKIEECGEPLAPIPPTLFAFTDPHPYVALGAPYGNANPWMLRAGVITALVRAQKTLTTLHPGWKLKLFDAYRPIPVQKFMVEREFALLATAQNLDPTRLTEEQRKNLLPHVLRLLAIPDENPRHPPPHSTGAALDLTLQDDSGAEVDMGSPIDENSPRSLPDHYNVSRETSHTKFAAHRALLRQVMENQGFAQHPTEWWHFSLGDQMWALATHKPHARYGRADLVV